MKKVALLCVLSAAVGAVLALSVIGPPTGEPQTAAQELPRPPLPRVPFAPRAQAAPRVEAESPDALADQSPPGSDELTPEERVAVAVYENVNRSVVNITTESVRTDRFLLFDIASKGEGSGSVITREGHILTNFHVVEEAQQIQVTLFDGSGYSARLVGKDPASDVAILKIDAPPELLHPVTFGDSTRLRVGQRVFAIGNPFGLERTLSTGTISSLNRAVPGRKTYRTFKQIIQIDAAINPGNSGGPLLDSRGRMIGMNWAIASKTGESAGVGFAIPISTIGRVVPQLLKSGHVIRPDVGIAKVYQMERGQGLLIALLVPGGPAEQAGLRGPQVVRKRQGPFLVESVNRLAADLIVAVDGQPARTADDFLTLIESKQPGDEVGITVIRGGRELRVPVRLGAGE